MNYALYGQNVSWFKILSWELPGWYWWGLLSPLILRFTRRFPPFQYHWYENVPVHLLAGAAFSIVHLLLHVLTAYGIDFLSHSVEKPLVSMLTANFFSRFTWRMMVYFIILIACLALDAQRRASRLTVQLARAEMQALKMQLQPHFLFNTLQAISELMHRDLRAADEMTVRLADFLRLTLENTGAQRVTLQNELKFLKCYLDIQEVRFRDRMEVVMDVSSEARHGMIPNLILQPIVENAVQHGIAPRSSHGYIEVRAARNGDRLQVQVRDNRTGLAEGSDVEDYFKKGVGLSNARARLRQLYGNRFRLDLTNASEGGLVVLIEIPWESREI